MLQNDEANLERIFQAVPAWPVVRVCVDHVEPEAGVVVVADVDGEVEPAGEVGQGGGAGVRQGIENLQLIKCCHNFF